MDNKNFLLVLAVFPLATFADSPNTQVSNFFANSVNVDVGSCSKVASNDLEFACHRLEKGDGFAIFSRAYVPSKEVDNDTYFKTTIFFKRKPAFGQKISLPSDDVFAFQSYGPSSFPGSSGCYGEATSGEIQMNKGSNGVLSVSYKISFHMKSPHDYPKECRDEDIVTRSFEATPINFRDLTPWLGLKMKTSDSWNESHPEPHPN